MGSRDFRIALKARQEIDYQEPLFTTDGSLEKIYEQSKFISFTYNKIQKSKGSELYISAAKLNASAVLHLLYQAVISHFLIEQDHDFFSRITPQIIKNHSCQEVLSFYSKEFPSPLLMTQEPTAPYVMEETARGFFIHQVLTDNPAVVKAIKPFLRPQGVQFPSASQALSALMGGFAESAPRLGEHEEDLYSFLTAPAKAHPDSLSKQISFIMRHWEEIIPDKIKLFLLRALDFVQEEEMPRAIPGGGPGPYSIPTFSKEDQEYEAYSPDRNWMPNVIMIAKSTLVWLDQLSKTYGYSIQTLDQIPERELDILAKRGFTGLWLIGLWERSKASQKIKHLCGNPEAEASAYSLHSYSIATAIGGWEAFQKLDKTCKARGIRLASDMVPNHTGLDSDWVMNHPEYFVRTPWPPFPSYSYTKENLSSDPAIEITLEDHYFDKTDAAVTFRRINKKTHEVSYIFHGNDGTSMPWNDTAQLDFLNPDTREAVIQQILHVARNFHIIRFDAAMTLAKRHVQRLWYPKPGTGGAIPGRAGCGLTEEEFSQRMPVEFWREVVDRVAQEAPDTLLLAEAFWMMEGYFVRTLGMHRVYNSAFMNMLKQEENKKYRETVKNTLAFDPEVLKRFVNFMNNPDEDTAIAQFGDGDKYFGVCTLLTTMPGLPMFGHGQIEGFHEKYGMEYRKAYWNEYPNEPLITEHEKRIFPLLRMRYLFSGVEYFEFFDVVDADGVSESVFAYVNGTAEKRALVLYNNQYHRAQGKITSSVPKLSRHPEHSRSLKTTTLGESLGLSLGGRRYTLYTSFPDTLTYIIPSMMIYDEGMWVSLEGYETKLFYNIREVEDFDGSYETLYLQLGKKGCAHFSDELQAIRIAPLYKALENFRSDTMFELISSIIHHQSKPNENRKYMLLAGEAYARLSAMYDTLPQALRDAIPKPSHEVQPKEMLQYVQHLSSALQEGSLFSSGAVIVEELPLLIQISLLLKAFIPKNATANNLYEIAKSLLLHRFFQEQCNELGCSQEIIDRLIRRAILLVMPSPYMVQAIQKKSPPKTLLQLLLSDEYIQKLIGANEYQGTLWYRKEYFQETMFDIALGVCIAMGEDVIATTHSYLRSFLRSDLQAEYIIDHLIEGVSFSL